MSSLRLNDNRTHVHRLSLFKLSFDVPRVEFLTQRSQRVFPSRNSFLGPFGGPKEVKINEKLSLEDNKNEESEKVDFLHPSLAKSLFLGSHEGQDGASMTLGNDFYGN